MEKLTGVWLIALLSFVCLSCEEDRGWTSFCTFLMSFTIQAVTFLSSWRWILGCVWNAELAFSYPRQFRSGWFWCGLLSMLFMVRAYTSGFDELQIKWDQMNRPVSVGFTCAELWFKVPVFLIVHPHNWSHALMSGFKDSLLHRHSSSCLYKRGHDLSPAFNQTKLSSEEKLVFYGSSKWLLVQLTGLFVLKGQ